ncbi:YesL family protein [Peribacillus kribbensis]|uniref:YesL family protein n=1 Tax=Peribacillus kribbensis TaxID=356658 RepID=UPI0004079DB7|nr:YesL family protein [Peribacillus kribbensis]
MYKRSMNGLFALTEWITRFAYVNLLWIGFSIIGLVLLGFFPATAAMFTVIRKWMMGERDIPVYKTFLGAYKGEFLRSNGLGFILVLASGLIMADLYFMKNNTQIASIFHIPLYLFMIAVILTSLYAFPVFVHYNVKSFQIIKNAFFIMLINPIHNIIMLLGLTAIYFIVKTLPGLLFFFGGSIAASIIMSSCYLAFQRVESKKKETLSL